MSSDTESESEQDRERTQDSNLLKSEEFIHPDGYRLSLDEALRILDIPDAYSHTPGLSLALTHQLDLASHDVGTGFDQRAARTFQRLVTGKALNNLLQVRSKLRAEQPASVKHFVTWVDIILAKLGSLVLSVVDEPSKRQHSGIYSETINKHIEQDAARAASQLPEQWEAFPSALNAQHLSPATKRLILRLLFGVLVMRSDLDGVHEMTASELQGILDVLEASVHDFVQLDTPARSPPISRDKTDCAFFLSLYATMDAKRWSIYGFPSDFAPVKPRFESHLLALLDSILRPLDEDVGLEWGAMDSIARATLFRWGKFVPWCWAIWVDHRLADAELVTIVTILWLGTIDYPSRSDGAVATATLSENAFAAFVALSNVLVYGVSQLEESSARAYPILLVLDKACLLLVSVFDGVVFAELCSDRRLGPYALRICRSVLRLSVIRPGLLEVDQNASALDSYLELLLKMNKATIQQSLAELQVDRQILFSRGVDSVFSKAKRLLIEGEVPPQPLSMIRFALGFLTLLCTSGVRGIILRENVSPFFMRLHDRLTVGAYSGGLRKTLLGPTITAITAAEEYFHLSGPFSFPQDELFWRLCLTNQQTGIYASLAQAQYIIRGKYPRGWLFSCEMLGHFRDLVLRTITQRMPCNLEQIAQLACPSFCVAIIQLLKEDVNAEARVAQCFFKNSPWTMMLCVELKVLLSSVTPLVNRGPHLERMRRMLVDVGGNLLDVLSGINSSGYGTGGISHFDTQLSFHQSQVIMITTEKGFCLSS